MSVLIYPPLLLPSRIPSVVDGMVAYTHSKSIVVDVLCPGLPWIYSFWVNVVGLRPAICVRVLIESEETRLRQAHETILSL